MYGSGKPCPPHGAGAHCDDTACPSFQHACRHHKILPYCTPPPSKPPRSSSTLTSCCERLPGARFTRVSHSPWRMIFISQICFSSPVLQCCDPFATPSSLQLDPDLGPACCTLTSQHTAHRLGAPTRLESKAAFTGRELMLESSSPNDHGSRVTLNPKPPTLKP